MRIFNFLFRIFCWYLPLMFFTFLLFGCNPIDYIINHFIKDMIEEPFEMIVFGIWFGFLAWVILYVVTFIISIIFLLMDNKIGNFFVIYSEKIYKFFNKYSYLDKVFGSIIKIFEDENKSKSLHQIIKNSSVLNICNYGWGDKIRVAGDGVIILSKNSAYKTSLDLVNHIVNTFNYRIVSSSGGDNQYTLAKI